MIVQHARLLGGLSFYQERGGNRLRRAAGAVARRPHSDPRRLTAVKTRQIHRSCTIPPLSGGRYPVDEISGVSWSPGEFRGMFLLNTPPLSQSGTLRVMREALLGGWGLSLFYAFLYISKFFRRWTGLGTLEGLVTAYSFLDAFPRQEKSLFVPQCASARIFVAGSTIVLSTPSFESSVLAASVPYKSLSVAKGCIAPSGKQLSQHLIPFKIEALTGRGKAYLK